jgi:hypothetical protein
MGAKKRGRFEEAENYLKLCEALENQPLREQEKLSSLHQG